MQQRLGFALRASLAEKGWKPPDLARALGKDPSTVARWCNGESVPNLFMVRPIAEALGVPADFIYDPPAVPEYPISLEYLVRKATAEGVEEGLQRARTPRPKKRAS